MKKYNKKPADNRGFVKRNYDWGKQVVIKHSAAGIISLIISSVVPMLEQWHSDKLQTDTIISVETNCKSDVKDVKEDLQRQIDDFKKEQIERDKAQWQAISGKQDKMQWQAPNVANKSSK